MYKLVKSSDVIDIRDGTHDSPKYIEKGYPLITSKNLKAGKVCLVDVNYVSQDDYNKINKRSKVDLGDILYSMIGSIGNYALVEKIPEYAIKNVALFKFNDERLFNKYFYYLLNSSYIENQIRSQQKGGTQKFVTLKILRNFKIPLPNLVTQKRIATILDEADKLRKFNKEIIQKYDKLTRSLFLEMFGDLKLKTTSWKIKKIKDVVKDYKNGASVKPNEFKTEGFPVLHKGAIKKNGILEFDYGKKIFVDKYVFEKYKKSVIDENYVVVTLRDLVSTGPSIGLMASLNKYINKKYVLAQGAYGFTVKNEFINPIYLTFWSNSVPYRAELSKYWVGSTQIHLRSSSFFELDIPLPPIELQNQFAERIQIIEQQKQNAQEALQKSENLFNSLLQKAFKGELV